MVKYRQYEPHMPVVDNMFVPSYTATTEGSAQRTVGLHKSPEQPLVRICHVTVHFNTNTMATSCNQYICDISLLVLSSLITGYYS